MQFVASLLPIIIYILVVYKIDHFALVNKRRLLQLVVGGMLMALVCFGLFSWLDGVLPDGSHPVVEEGVKAVPLLVLAGRKRMVFFIDSVICGAAVGGGFSILENLFYLVLGQDAGLGTMLFRGLEVALVHIGCSAVVAAGLVLLVRQTERWRSRLGVKPFDVVMTILLLLAAVAAHVCHNHLHFNPVMQFVSVLGVMGGLLAWTYFYDVDMIHRWLDGGLDQQIQLFQSIRDGQLINTSTGAFLESVKASFPPLVYFDIICYVRLHAELSVTAKVRFLMRESGMLPPLGEHERQQVLAKYREFKQMEKNMGASAMLTIAPVVKLHPADVNAFRNLISECSKRFIIPLQ